MCPRHLVMQNMTPGVTLCCTVVCYKLTLTRARLSFSEKVTQVLFYVVTMTQEYMAT